MSLRILCPHCGKIFLKVPAVRIGAEAKCTSCGQSFIASSELIAQATRDDREILTAAVVTEPRDASRAPPYPQAGSDQGSGQPTSPFSATAAVSPPYWLWVNDKAQGPHTVDELRASLSAGRINRETLAWVAGASKWQPIRKIPAIRGVTSRSRLILESIGARLLGLLGILGVAAMRGLKMGVVKQGKQWELWQTMFWFVAVPLFVFLVGWWLWKIATGSTTANGKNDPPRGAGDHAVPAAPSAGANGNQWWITVDSRVTGPFTTVALTHAVLTGDFPPSTPACPVGSSAWRPLSDWPELTQNRVPG